MKQSLWIALAAIILFGLFGSAFVVREAQTGMVLNLGRVVRSDHKPGLHVPDPGGGVTAHGPRCPLQGAQHRGRALATSPAEQKDVSVDFFTIWLHLQRRRLLPRHRRRETVAEARLAPIITDSLRNQINSSTLQQLVAGRPAS